LPDSLEILENKVTSRWKKVCGCFLMGAGAEKHPVANYGKDTK
jgi:hypothetical protein